MAESQPHPLILPGPIWYNGYRKRSAFCLFPQRPASPGKELVSEKKPPIENEYRNWGYSIEKPLISILDYRKTPNLVGHCWETTLPEASAWTYVLTPRCRAGFTIASISLA
jgi:hypothetical protein